MKIIRSLIMVVSCAVVGAGFLTLSSCKCKKECKKAERNVKKEYKHAKHEVKHQKNAIKKKARKVSNDLNAK